MIDQTLVFPKNFILGAATAAYQIEGAWQADGKGESIWDRFSHTPGKVEQGDTGDIACDHYHRWAEDVALMKDLGLKAYRFSISWPRILPAGRGKVNPAGIAFYSRLVDALLEAGIEPFVTLYHWDLPQVLQEAGGWPARMIVEAFAEYAHAVTQPLGDRVKNWITLNELQVVAFIGYEEGRHAPGHKSLYETLAASHHLLLAHSQAVPVIRANCPDGRVGIVLNLTPQVPASPSMPDRKAAWRADGQINRWYLDPLAGRGYPHDMVKDYGIDLDFVQPGDLKQISTPVDFLGINNYTRDILRAKSVSPQENAPVTVFRSSEITEMGWEVHPQGLYTMLGRLHFEYGFPAIYVTENGAAFRDQLSPDGKVDDPERCAYLAGHLAMVNKAIQAGVPVQGYFVWSLLDNFEWAHGYSKRFGIVYIDYPTQRRIPKTSAHWYRSLIEENIQAWNKRTP